MPSLRERFRGALLGLAAGDAVGTTVEFAPRGSFPPVTDMVGGGPFDLPAGAWTDDTSMALCLAESLVACDGFDPVDQLSRYSRWYRDGHLSSTGRCFDIGDATRAAIERFERTGEPFPGDAAPEAAGNGPIMKLAPVAMAFLGDPERAIRHAGECARTTHGAPQAIDATRWFGAVLVAALREEEPRHEPEHPEVIAVAGGSFREREVRGSGYIVASLEAALWAFHSTPDFRSAILAAVNLGEDADTTAAVCGQLAGATYGVQGIPPEWLERLVMREGIEQLADQLLLLPTRLRFRDAYGFPLPRTTQDGVLYAKGWTVRWRWFDDGLRVHSTHRMTNETYDRIALDGSLRSISAPAEFHLDAPAARERYHREWSDHADRLRRDGMDPPPGEPSPPYDRETQMAWRPDGGAWRVEDV